MFIYFIGFNFYGEFMKMLQNLLLNLDIKLLFYWVSEVRKNIVIDIEIMFDGGYNDLDDFNDEE